MLTLWWYLSKIDRPISERWVISKFCTSVESNNRVMTTLLKAPFSRICTELSFGVKGPKSIASQKLVKPGSAASIDRSIKFGNLWKIESRKQVLLGWNQHRNLSWKEVTLSKVGCPSSNSCKTSGTCSQIFT